MCLLSDSCRWSVAGIGSCFGITICVSNAQVKHNPNGVQQSKQQLLRLDREREKKTDWKYTYWISKKAILNIIKFCLKIMRENWYGKYSAVVPGEQNKIDYWVVEMNGIVLEHTTHRHTHGTTPYINSLFSESTFSFLIDLAIAVLFFFLHSISFFSLFNFYCCAYSISLHSLLPTNEQNTLSVYVIYAALRRRQIGKKKNTKTMSISHR